MPNTIKIYNKEHEVEELSLRTIAAMRDSKILSLTPYDDVDIMKLVDEYRSQAIEVELPINTNLDDVIEWLKIKHDEDIRDYKAKFNGVWLYSININEIDAYVSITGMTREGCIKREQIERYRNELRLAQEKEDAENNLEARIEDGKKEIIPAKWEAWEEFVEKYSRPPYYLHAIDTVIKYLGKLNKNYLSVAEITDEFFLEFGNDTGDWYTSCILTNIAKFASRGIDMYRRACFVAKSKGEKIFNNNDFFKRAENINKLVDKGIPFLEAESLVDQKMYDVKIGDILQFDVINIDDKLYEGLSNTSKYAIIARIGSYYATYLFSENSYTRYISNIYDRKTQIGTNEKPIVKIEEAGITGVDKRNTIPKKANLRIKIDETKEKINPSIILKAYKEISEFSKEIDTNRINSLVIDCIAEQNHKRLTKKI